MKNLVLSPDAEERKNTPIFSGVMNYFPLALAAVARHSKMGNDQHNPGQPLHWARGKSTDHENCIARHLIDVHTVDPATGENIEARALAWRALALLQEIEERRLGAPMSRGCRIAEQPKDDTIHVVVGVIVDRRGRVFLQRRSFKDEHFPGSWECPGGTIEPGETDYSALQRELREELGIEVEFATVPAIPLWRGQINGYRGQRHDFRFYRVTTWQGDIDAIDGQEGMMWCFAHEIPSGLTPANALAWPDIQAAVKRLRRAR